MTTTHRRARTHLTRAAGWIVFVVVMAVWFVLAALLNPMSY